MSDDVNFSNAVYCKEERHTRASWIIYLDYSTYHTHNASKEESRVEGRDWGEGREEGEEETVATKVSISVFFTPLSHHKNVHFPPCFMTPPSYNIFL